MRLTAAKPSAPTVAAPANTAVALTRSAQGALRADLRVAQTVGSTDFPGYRKALVALSRGKLTAGERLFSIAASRPEDLAEERKALASIKSLKQIAPAEATAAFQRSCDLGYGRSPEVRIDPLIRLATREDPAIVKDPRFKKEWLDTPELAKSMAHAVLETHQADLAELAKGGHEALSDIAQHPVHQELEAQVMLKVESLLPVGDHDIECRTAIREAIVEHLPWGEDSDEWMQSLAA
ncbi:hypothetical protein [Roseomonas genomospecies 6]|uniref:Uncharacterized protein n=1 Tax=Roseomonas genomospecies 6 TaxID=214106 RepID=A0A9W7KS32_9PROT|nr:hypothetical protein [Roseomonas genomospecies 6]KAA0677604.1 hypothetical protein DS843_22455 [Roseomonas genomospecies 6]